MDAIEGARGPRPLHEVTIIVAIKCFLFRRRDFARTYFAYSWSKTLKVDPFRRMIEQDMLSCFKNDQHHFLPVLVVPISAFAPSAWALGLCQSWVGSRKIERGSHRTLPEREQPRRRGP